MQYEGQSAVYPMKYAHGFVVLYLNFVAFLEKVLDDINPNSSGLLPWYSDDCPSASEVTQRDMNIDGLVQDCSNSSALAMELLQSCT